MLAWGVLYLSTGVDGEPVAVSGLVASPAEPANAPRPVLSSGHYSVGLSDNCAPSREGVAAVLELAQPFVDKGFVFASTDYQGLGTPGLNPYYIGKTAGSDVLDAARAAARLPEAGAGTDVALLGESQGAHAALWAAEIAPTYAPELDAIGVVASSTVADVTALLASARLPDSGEISWVASLQIVWVWHHLLDLPIDGVIGDEDLEIAQGFQEECPGFRTLPSGPPLLIDLATIPAWKQQMAANTPGHTPAAAPIVMEHGTADQLDMATATRDRLCAAGNTVEFIAVEGGGHLEPLQRAGRREEVAEWFTALLEGGSAANDC